MRVKGQILKAPLGVEGAHVVVECHRRRSPSLDPVISNELGSIFPWNKKSVSQAKNINVQVSQHFENWDNFANQCSVCLHAVDGKGNFLANNPELKAMGYEPDAYIAIYRRLLSQALASPG